MSFVSYKVGLLKRALTKVYEGIFQQNRLPVAVSMRELQRLPGRGGSRGGHVSQRTEDQEPGLFSG